PGAFVSMRPFATSKMPLLRISLILSRGRAVERRARVLAVERCVVREEHVVPDLPQPGLLLEHLHLAGEALQRVELERARRVHDVELAALELVHALGAL